MISWRFGFKKKKTAPPKCPECGNSKHNRQIKSKVWRCAACFRKFVVDGKAKPKARPRPQPVHRQIGEDIEDVEDFEIF
jgi:ribosomal protein L37AE/L43A